MAVVRHFEVIKFRRSAGECNRAFESIHANALRILAEMIIAIINNEVDDDP